MALIGANELKKKMLIEIDGQPFNVLDVFFATPTARGASTMVRTRLKNLLNGAVLEKTFRTSEKFPEPDVEIATVSYLYSDGDGFHFMDESSYEQFSLPHTTVEDALPYLEPSSTVQVLEVDGKPSGVQLPSSVELAVSETEPGVRGDTVSNVTKPATLETGAVVQVPLFVNVGDRIKVDPREGRYISRA